MEEIIKKRIIGVEGMTCEGCENRINMALTGLEGVKSVKAEKSGTVRVVYDLMKINLKAVEEKIAGLNYTISSNFLNRVKLGWIHFTEQNEHDNIAHPNTSCCSIAGAENYSFRLRK